VTPATRPCPLCGNPTAPGALLEAHVGPTKGHPRADVVVWLCPACALAVTDPGYQRPTVGGWAR
jgi:ribosomal protein L37AE/L43A